MDLHRPPLAFIALLLLPCSLLVLMCSLSCFPFVLLLLFSTLPFSAPGSSPSPTLWHTDPSPLVYSRLHSSSFIVLFEINLRKNILLPEQMRNSLPCFCAQAPLSLSMFICIFGLRKTHSSARLLCDHEHYIIAQFLCLENGIMTIVTKNLRITEWLRLEGTSGGHLVQHPCSSRGT